MDLEVFEDDPDGSIATVCTLAEFVAANEGLTDEDAAAIEALAVGETHRGGGGAGAGWAVRRCS